MKKILKLKRKLSVALTIDDGQLIAHEPIESDFRAVWSKLFSGHEIHAQADVLPIIVETIPGIETIIDGIYKSGPVVMNVGDDYSSFEITIFPRAHAIIFGIFDITGARLLQQQVQRQKDAIEIIDHAHPGALFQVKRDANSLMSLDFASPRLPEIMQIPGLRVDGFIESMPTETRDALYNAFRNNDGKNEIVVEGILARPHKRYWTIRASVLSVEKDGATTFLGVLENNTEKMLQLEQLEYTSSFLRSVTENIPICVAVTNIAKKQYLYVNQELCRVTGHPEESFLTGGLVFSRDNVIFSAKDEFLQNIIKGRDYYNDPSNDFDQVMRAPMHIRTKNGEERHLRMFFRPLGGKSENGTYDTFIHIAEDITDQLRLENQRRKDEILLIQSNKMAELGEMASCIAHEINNPLSIMLHLLENIESRHKDEEFNRIFQTLDRISKIVKSLTGFARDAGEAGPGDKPIPLSTVIADTMLLCQNRLLNRSIDFKASGDLEACPHINDTLLSQVFLNLINNSYDALENQTESRWLKLEAKVKSNALTITFTDSGLAPDIETMQSWFEPFTTTKPKGKGTGLGLSICQNLLRAAGGAIRPLNTKHTSFQISLPLWKKSESK